MKKLFLMTCFIIGFLFIPAAVIFAASVDGGETIGIDGVGSYFISLAALAGAVLSVTEFIKRIIHTSGSVAVILSWIVSLLIALIGWWLNLGIFENMTIVWVPIYGIAAGVVSNSLFDIGIVNAFLKLLGQKIPKK